MLSDVAMALPRWPIIGRRPELEVFERALGSGDQAGLVIHGRPGTGKTRLADECADLAAASGHPTERVAGSRTTALLPLGAMAALLADGLGRPGPDGQLDAAALFEQARQALRKRHGGRRLVTVVDDMALLDAASLALLGYLAAQKAIFLVATVRIGEPVPDLLTSLWREGRMERVDIHDLSRAHLDTLLHLALRRPIEAGSCDSPLVTARARHAGAARTRDGQELAGASSDFEALGAILLAAEAAAGAAEALLRAGDRRAATAALRRSIELAAACEGAVTPGLFHAATAHAAAAPLSGREREIAMLAAAGIASKDIADRLYLSVRTVNNHLQHAYTKLGVTGRVDLAQALGGIA
jgi:DNA-binding CsgD family transcriptional regulator